MCRRTVFVAILAVLLSLAAVAVGGYSGAQRLLVQEITSPLGFEETVSALQTRAADQGWKVPKVYDMQKASAEAGYTVAPVAVIELCRPEYAARLLAQDSSRFVSSFMPCRLAIYERADGQVVLSRMNTGLMSHLFPGEIADVMGQATRDTLAIIDAALFAADQAG